MGVSKEDYSKGSETSDGIIMSLSDLQKLLEKVPGAKKRRTYDSVLVKVTDISVVERVETDIKGMGYNTESMESIRKPMEKEAQQKQMMLGGLGAISLFVAALGITNTMIMSISERTREIGIMKALGCYVTDIRIMFLSEAGAIGLIGGVIGCIISFCASVTINLVSLGPSLENLLPAMFGGGDVTRVSVIPPWLLLFAVVFSDEQGRADPGTGGHQKRVRRREFAPAGKGPHLSPRFFTAAARKWKKAVASRPRT